MQPPFTHVHRLPRTGPFNLRVLHAWRPQVLPPHGWYCTWALLPALAPFPSIPSLSHMHGAIALNNSERDRLTILLGQTTPLATDAAPLCCHRCCHYMSRRCFPGGAATATAPACT